MVVRSWALEVVVSVSRLAICLVGAEAAKSAGVLGSLSGYGCSIVT